MRNLDAVNFEFLRPTSAALWAPILPFFSGIFGWVLVSETNPAPFSENPLAVFCSIITAVACFAFAIPLVYKWNWRAEFFGAPLLYLSSIALLGIIPSLCLGLYSNLPAWIRGSVVVTYCVSHFIWCRRFIFFYRKIYVDRELFSLLYDEDDDAIYYLQKVDEYFFEKLKVFRQVPSNRYFVLCLFFSVGVLFFQGSVRDVTGLPFIHTFLTISGLPVSLFCIGLATRGWLIFYFYPMKIRKMTGKYVYVDMDSLPIGFKDQIKRWKARKRQRTG